MKGDLASVGERFWFARVGPKPLALLRLLFFAWLFLWYWGYDFRAVGLHPVEIWRPVHLLQVLGLGTMPSTQALAVLQILWKASLLSASVGLFTRASCGFACLLGAYLLALTHSFHKINHSDGALVIAMGVFAFARSGEAWSLDRVMRRGGSVRSTRLPAGSGEYWWPIQMVRVLSALVFFGAGIAKVVHGGLPWLWSDALYNYVSLCQLVREPLLVVDLPWESYKWLWRALAFGTVSIELSAPLALFSSRARAVIVPGLLSLQVGILLVMGDNFTQFMALYLFWIPWGSILDARSPDDEAGDIASEDERRTSSAGRLGVGESSLLPASLRTAVDEKAA